MAANFSEGLDQLGRSILEFFSSIEGFIGASGNYVQYEELELYGLKMSKVIRLTGIGKESDSYDFGSPVPTR